MPARRMLSTATFADWRTAGHAAKRATSRTRNESRHAIAYAAAIFPAASSSPRRSDCHRRRDSATLNSVSADTAHRSNPMRASTFQRYDAPDTSATESGKRTTVSETSVAYITSPVASKTVTRYRSAPATGLQRSSFTAATAPTGDRGMGTVAGGGGGGPRCTGRRSSPGDESRRSSTAAAASGTTIRYHRRPPAETESSRG